MLNSLLIEGELVQDPLFRRKPDGLQVCTFTLLHRRKVESGGEGHYFDVEARGKLAEVIRDNGRAGRGVRVVGALHEVRWVDESEKQRSKVFIIAEHVEFRPEPKEKLPGKPVRSSTGKGK